MLVARDQTATERDYYSVDLEAADGVTITAAVWETTKGSLLTVVSDDFDGLKAQALIGAFEPVGGRAAEAFVICTTTLSTGQRDVSQWLVTVSKKGSK